MFALTVSDSDDDDLLKKNLIVNYLPQSFNDLELYNVFTPFGPLESVRIMRDLKTGYSFGFGFVNFVNEEDATAARNTLNGFRVGTKRMKVSFARPPSEAIKHTNLYITNLPRHMTEKNLMEIFKPFGAIIQSKLLRDKYTNLPRGVAFIRYEKRFQASAAMTGLNNTIPDGCTEKIRIRLAQDHGKQKAAYLAGFEAGRSQQLDRLQRKAAGNKPKSKSKSKARKLQGFRYISTPFTRY